VKVASVKAYGYRLPGGLVDTRGCGVTFRQIQNLGGSASNRIIMAALVCAALEALFSIGTDKL
jgi:hypothetical protein